MALDREEFKNRIQEHLGDALLAFYQAILEKKHFDKDRTRSWQDGMCPPLKRIFPNMFLLPVEGLWNKQEAYEEAVEETRRADADYCRAAASLFRQNFERSEKISVSIDGEDTHAFWQLVARYAEYATAEFCIIEKQDAQYSTG